MDIHPDKELDCRGMNCPMPVVNTKMAINQMQVGEVLRMVATDIGSKSDIPAWAKKTGHELLEQREENGEYVFYVKKTK